MVKIYLEEESLQDDDNIIHNFVWCKETYLKEDSIKIEYSDPDNDVFHEYFLSVRDARELWNEVIKKAC